MPFSEKAFFKFELFSGNKRSVRVFAHVFLVKEVILESVIYEPSQEGNVSAWPEAGVNVRFGSGSGETRINGDKFCPFFNGRLNPSKTEL